MLRPLLRLRVDEDLEAGAMVLGSLCVYAIITIGICAHSELRTFSSAAARIFFITAYIRVRHQFRPRLPRALSAFIDELSTGPARAVHTRRDLPV